LGNLGTLVERQSAPAAVAPAVEAVAPPAGDAAQPATVPVSSTPAPATSATPGVAPGPDENRNAAAAALAASGQNESSPAALLTQATLPAVKVLGDPNGPLASPAPQGRAKEKAALPALPVEGAKPQKVSNDGRR
ncbi:MAG: hypothetical protein INR62_04545, partial [Rhodospirillales bacterium]|nr:hypothetical protein [Acetobacter sp.]